MGIDCTLIPVECEKDGWGYGHSIVSLSRDYDFWDKLRSLPDAGPVPADFNTFYGTVPDGSLKGEHGYGKTEKDPYGSPLRCVRAGDIANDEAIEAVRPAQQSGARLLREAASGATHRVVLALKPLQVRTVPSSSEVSDEGEGERG